MADKKHPVEEPPPAAEAAAAPKRRLHLSRFATLALVLVAQVALAYVVQRTLLFPADPLANATITALDTEREEGEEAKPAEHTAETQVVTLDEIVVNPAATAGRRYLAVTVGLLMAGEEPQQTVDKNAPVIRDALISLLSSKHLEQLADIAYRDSLKLEIKEAVNGKLHDAPVQGVVFSGYVLQ